MTAPLGAAVSVHGIRVGTLWRLDDDENHEFRFDDAWLADAGRPILGQLFEDRRPRSIETSGLPNWFAHLLPQGPWSRALHRWAALPEECSDLKLLLAVAGDLPGALDLAPIQGGLFDAARATRPSPAPGRVRFTLAGNQWKLSVRRNERGLVVPVLGEDGEYVAKFHDPVHRDLPRIECATLTWARQAGMPVPEARLAAADEFVDLPPDLPLGDGRVLLVRRFDRGENGLRVHREELAQVVDRVPGNVPGGQYSGSSEQIAALVGALCPTDVAAFLDRLIFTVCSGDGDAHWKNWGLVYPDRRRARLAPAYDLVPTILFPDLDRELALSLGGKRRFEEVRRADLTALARLIGWTEHEIANHLDDACARIRGAFDGLSERFKRAELARIRTHMDHMWAR